MNAADRSAAENTAAKLCNDYKQQFGFSDDRSVLSCITDVTNYLHEQMSAPAAAATASAAPDAVAPAPTVSSPVPALKSPAATVGLILACVYYNVQHNYHHD